MRVVIAGGGVAALEALLALRTMAGHVVELTLLSPNREFLYRPVTVTEAFDRGAARSYDLEEIVCEKGAGHAVWDTLAAVDPSARVAVTGRGERIEFDALVIATGAIAHEPLPGALTFRGRDDVAAMRAIADELVEGRISSVAFALGAERMWSLPLYELALLTAAHVREHDRDDVTIRLVTPEEEPLALFGPETAAAVGPLLAARGIDVRCSSLPASIEGRALLLAGGARIHADRFVTLPVLEGPRIPGVPHDRHGFIPVDAHGRVVGLSDVYAAGDATAFPLKQGGLAAQQADAIAEVIAAHAGAAIKPRPFTPVLRGLLLTGGAPLYLRCEPQHVARGSSVAIDASTLRHTSQGASLASGQALWWPPAKIAGRYLGPYLATARPDPLGSHVLADRAPIAGSGDSEAEQHDAVELALLLAECDARWGDYSSALDALGTAELLAGTLTPEYEAKRREWHAAEIGAPLVRSP